MHRGEVLRADAGLCRDAAEMQPRQRPSPRGGRERGGRVPRADTTTWPRASPQLTLPLNLSQLSSKCCECGFSYEECQAGYVNTIDWKEWTIENAGYDPTVASPIKMAQSMAGTGTASMTECSTLPKAGNCAALPFPPPTPPFSPPSPLPSPPPLAPSWFEEAFPAIPWHWFGVGGTQ